jgi:hypothetical protein
MPASGKLILCICTDLRLPDAAAGKRTHIDGIDYTSDSLYPDIICIDNSAARAQPLKAVSARRSRPWPTRSRRPRHRQIGQGRLCACGDRADREQRQNPRTKITDRKAATGLMNGVAMAGIAVAQFRIRPTHYLATAMADISGDEAGMLMGLLLGPSLGNKILTGKRCAKSSFFPLQGSMSTPPYRLLSGHTGL